MKKEDVRGFETLGSIWLIFIMVVLVGMSEGQAITGEILLGISLLLVITAITCLACFAPHILGGRRLDE